MRRLLLIVLLVVPVPALAQSPLTPRASYFPKLEFSAVQDTSNRQRCDGLTLTNVLIAAEAISEYADATSTMLCVGSGHCTEGNPILRPIQTRPLFFAAAKGGQAAALSYLLIKYRCSNKTLVRVTAISLTAFFSYISYRNADFSPGGLGVLEP